MMTLRSCCYTIFLIMCKCCVSTRIYDEIILPLFDFVFFFVDSERRGRESVKIDEATFEIIFLRILKKQVKINWISDSEKSLANNFWCAIKCYIIIDCSFVCIICNSVKIQKKPVNWNFFICDENFQ